MRPSILAGLLFVSCSHIPTASKVRCTTICGVRYIGNTSCAEVQEWEDRTLLSIDAYQIRKMSVVSALTRGAPNAGDRIVAETFATVGEPWTHDEVCGAMKDTIVEATGEPGCLLFGDRMEIKEERYIDFAIGIMMSLDMCYVPAIAKWKERGIQQALGKQGSFEEDTAADE